MKKEVFNVKFKPSDRSKLSEFEIFYKDIPLLIRFLIEEMMEHSESKKKES